MSKIVLEDFNEGDGFYKVNLAYLSKEQVEEIENIVKKWNPELKESEDEKIRKCVKYAIDKLFLKEKIVCDVCKDNVLETLYCDLKKLRNE